MLPALPPFVTPGVLLGISGLYYSLQQWHNEYHSRRALDRVQSRRCKSSSASHAGTADQNRAVRHGRCVSTERSIELPSLTQLHDATFALEAVGASVPEADLFAELGSWTQGATFRYPLVFDPSYEEGITSSVNDEVMANKTREQLGRTGTDSNLFGYTLVGRDLTDTSER